MFKILHADKLQILQILHLVLIWGLNWQDIWVEHFDIIGSAFWIIKITLILRVLEDFVMEQSVEWNFMLTIQQHNALLCCVMCSPETETWYEEGLCS